MTATAAPRPRAAWSGRRLWMARLTRWAPMALLIILAVLYLAPFIWMVSTSLKTLPQSLASPPVIIPNPITLKPFTDALTKMNYPLAFRNTLIYAVPAVIGTVASCSLVAYGFALIQWRGRNLVFLVVLATMMLPTQVTLIPLYVIYAKLGWINTYLPLLVPTFLGSPFFIFLLRQFFLGMPKELIDAARLDGASELRILVTIVAPLSAPALITVGILTFIDKWNDFYGPLIFLQKPELHPLSLAVQVFQTQHGTDWPLLMAASVLVAAPLVALYFVAQRKFIEGITLTGFKG
ncbi:MAG TPA: carbohydrate ABC transporter permease [Candidatus Limnocylindrales bacterium]|nr:carbohydrate ABC transporter permease [Candidatus Limnocylindrales bacterium]